MEGRRVFREGRLRRPAGPANGKGERRIRIFRDTVRSRAQLTGHGRAATTKAGGIARRRRRSAAQSPTNEPGRRVVPPAHALPSAKARLEAAPDRLAAVGDPGENEGVGSGFPDFERSSSGRRFGGRSGAEIQRRAIHEGAASDDCRAVLRGVVGQSISLRARPRGSSLDYVHGRDLEEFGGSRKGGRARSGECNGASPFRKREVTGLAGSDHSKG
mmetsp:Transcript_31258/g.66152  ORF Transcript_31258/g.66152 Transcript_31258/m.66152 type:complete len:216 (+) Transcript_31258:472-1119(+)